jgi:hypothetical protein
MTIFLFSAAIGGCLGLWVGYMLMKHAIKNALIDSGIVHAIDRLADWQPRDDKTAEKPEWAK